MRTKKTNATEGIFGSLPADVDEKSFTAGVEAFRKALLITIATQVTEIILKDPVLRNVPDASIGLSVVDVLGVIEDLDVSLQAMH